MPAAVESAFFVGQPAWHGLGNLIQSAPTIKEGIPLAGLDWTVELEQLYTASGIETDHRACVRSSDRAVLGVVGPKYVPLQNAEAFEWFQPFLDAGCQLEAAGSLNEGRKVWVLARTPQGAGEVVPGDEVRQFLLAATSHDGSMATTLGTVQTRVVCANTLAVAMRESGVARVRHTSGAADAMARAQDSIAAAHAQFASHVERYRTLAATACSAANLRSYVRDVFELSELDDIPRAAKRVTELYDGGIGRNLGAGTMWNAYNAVTQYLTHERGRTADARLDSQWFGPARDLSARALNVASEYVKLAA